MSALASLKPSLPQATETDNRPSKWKSELETTHYVVDYQIMPKKLESSLSPGDEGAAPKQSDEPNQAQSIQIQHLVKKVNAFNATEDYKDTLVVEADDFVAMTIGTDSVDRSKSPVRRVAKKKVEEAKVRAPITMSKKVAEAQRVEDLLFRAKASTKVVEPKKQVEAPRHIFSPVK